MQYLITPGIVCQDIHISTLLEEKIHYLTDINFHKTFHNSISLIGMQVLQGTHYQDLAGI
jgi:hypothetical protein